MRLAFWRAGMAKALVEKTLAVPAPAVTRPVADPPSGDLDLRALGQVLMRKRGLIIAPTMLAAVVAIMAVNLVTPRYKSEARILIDGRENVFLRPNGERNEERTALDAEAVTSQVPMEEGTIHIGPSDYVPFLRDNKVCYVRMNMRGFGGLPMELDMKLVVEDSPNSAGVVVDAVRCVELARRAKIGGVLEEVSAALMKRPRKQMTDEEAAAGMDKWIERHT